MRCREFWPLAPKWVRNSRAIPSCDCLLRWRRSLSAGSTNIFPSEKRKGSSGFAQFVAATDLATRAGGREFESKEFSLKKLPQYFKLVFARSESVHGRSFDSKILGLRSK